MSTYHIESQLKHFEAVISSIKSSYNLVDTKTFNESIEDLFRIYNNITKEIEKQGAEE